VSGQIGESPIVIKAREKLVERAENLERPDRAAKIDRVGNRDLSAKIKETEKKLYGGRIFNSKELSSLQQETDDLKKRRSGFEDKSLELMDQLEILRKPSKTAKVSWLHWKPSGKNSRNNWW